MKSTNSNVKSIVFNQFDGKEGTFPIWREEMELVLMANDLWCLVDPDETEELGDKKTIPSRTQKAYALVALDLTRACRDVIRGLKERDPRAAWQAIIARFDRVTPVSKMALLDALLGLRYRGDMLGYVSDFNSVVSRLEAMDIKLHGELLVAILLRGLPGDYAVFVAALKHWERIPPLEEVIGMLCAEEQGRPAAPTNSYGTLGLTRSENYMSDMRCNECGKGGHTSANCWVLHPEKAPICRNCDKRGHIARSCRGSGNHNAEVALDGVQFPLFEEQEAPPISL
jgi:hypothetical protein